MKSIKYWTDYIHDWARGKGWWEQPSVPEKLALVHSEVSEALEEYRNDRMDVWVMEGSKKPEGFGIELADAMIRIMDLAGYLDIDLEELIEKKMSYNETRPYRHGGKKA